MIEVGAELPDLQVADDSGQVISTTSLLGGPLVLYFYPKDDTPGCSNQASQFRDLYDVFRKKNAEIVGVSRDSVASHQKFKAKFHLPFKLLSDVDSALCDAFDVIVEKNMYGKKSKGVRRSTFLFEAGGKLVAVWPNVSVEGHAEEVLEKI